ncbi:unnamed protein product [Urochloa humidicola]
MQRYYAQTPLCDRGNDSVVVSFVDEGGACSKAAATARRVLYELLRGDDGGMDPVRAGATSSSRTETHRPVITIAAAGADLELPPPVILRPHRPQKRAPLSSLHLPKLHPHHSGHHLTGAELAGSASTTCNTGGRLRSSFDLAYFI